ncbi:GNAT family N-acetyltransferase [Solicola sp. PLA-1-18]|uniref:GNAT family N-acetyltransferase n=1 Tax=Solicola sp. PLA-1-18 TaxID=3380532 RepID=UPI003B766750
MTTKGPAGYAIEPLREDHAEALAASYARSRRHLERWEPRRGEDFATPERQAATIRTALENDAAGRSASWVLVHGDDVVGRVNLNDVVRGAFDNGNLGYWVDVHHLRKGLATWAVAHACEAAYDMGLHRVQAATLLENGPSQKVLARSDFSWIGTAPEYLRIDGRWQDHHLFQRIVAPS